MTGKRKLSVAAAVLSVAVLAAVYYFFDPSEASWMPKCLWKTLTGTDCPGCGSQRMAYALMHGDLRAAWRANAFALCMIPVAGVFLWLELSRRRCPDLYRKVHSPWLARILVITVIYWWIARNV